jgi:glycosyltransferase involved in cell wall biosynthesis
MYAHYFYRWCTMGGVERSLINRALVLARTDPRFRMSISFLEGAPALPLFIRAIRHYGLADRILVTDSVPEEAELLVSIDTPGAFALRRADIPFVVECHTTYRENQRYLAELPDWVRIVAVPSDSLADELTKTRLVKRRPLVLPNIMPSAARNRPAPRQVWRHRPVAYIGRLDTWKNAPELVRLWSGIAALRDDVFFLLAGPQTADPETLDLLRREGILDRTLRLTSVPFESVPRLLALICAHRGLVTSSSKGESFGWLAAEAIVEGVPVILSANPGHRSIVADNGRFLYPLGQPSVGAYRASEALDRWDEFAGDLAPLSQAITNGARFHAAWETFCAAIR